MLVRVQPAEHREQKPLQTRAFVLPRREGLEPESLYIIYKICYDLTRNRTSQSNKRSLQMKLTDINFAQPLTSTIYGERFLNDTKGRFEEYSQVDPRYDPQGSISHIDLPFVWLPKERVNVFRSEPSTEVLQTVINGENHRFLWHPDVARQEFRVEGVLRAQPTSSTRTLLTERSPRVYVKTDLDKKHFRFIRRLQRSSVEHSIVICSDLRQACKHLPEGSRYAFLPESLGFSVRGGSHEGSGVIFRESVPYPYVSDTRVMMPYHSLYAEDPNRPDDKPLLVQMVELHSGVDKLGYFVSEVVGPILEAWVFLVSTRGLLPELHGQNALAEIDSSFRIRRVVHRDFQSLYSDQEIRANLGLPQFVKHIAGREQGTTVPAQYSIVFDNMISKYLLTRIAKSFTHHFGIEYETVCAAMKEHHRSLSNWRMAQFPRTTYRFGSQAHEQVGNEVALVDTGESPVFR